MALSLTQVAVEISINSGKTEVDFAELLNLFNRTIKPNDIKAILKFILFNQNLSIIRQLITQSSKLLQYHPLSLLCALPDFKQKQNIFEYLLPICQNQDLIDALLKNQTESVQILYLILEVSKRRLFLTLDQILYLITLKREALNNMIGWQIRQFTSVQANNLLLETSLELRSQLYNFNLIKDLLALHPNLYHDTFPDLLGEMIGRHLVAFGLSVPVTNLSDINWYLANLNQLLLYYLPPFKVSIVFEIINDIVSSNNEDEKLTPILSLVEMYLKFNL